MNKSILMATILMASSSLVQAEITDKEREMCETIGGTAKAMMTARQAGMPMQGVMKITMDAKNMSKPMKEMNEAMVMAAYEETKWSGDKMILHSVTEFENTVYAACLKGMDK